MIKKRDKGREPSGHLEAAHRKKEPYLNIKASGEEPVRTEPVHGTKGFRVKHDMNSAHQEKEQKF